MDKIQIVGFAEYTFLIEAEVIESKIGLKLYILKLGKKKLYSTEIYSFEAQV